MKQPTIRKICAQRYFLKKETNYTLVVMCRNVAIFSWLQLRHILYHQLSVLFALPQLEMNVENKACITKNKTSTFYVKICNAYPEHFSFSSAVM